MELFSNLPKSFKVTFVIYNQKLPQRNEIHQSKKHVQNPITKTQNKAQPMC